MLALLLSSSCTLFNRSNQNAAAYIQATNAYDADGTKYAEATKVLKAALAAGHLTDEQRVEWSTDKVAVRDAEDDVYDDLQAWKSPPYDKPATFDQHYAALRTAMRRVLRLARDAGGGL